MPEIGPMSYAEIGPMSVPRWPRSGRYWANIVWLSGSHVEIFNYVIVCVCVRACVCARVYGYMYVYIKLYIYIYI